MFDSQSVQVAETPCEQFPLNQKKWWAWISLLIYSFGPSLVEMTGKCAMLNSVFWLWDRTWKPKFHLWLSVAAESRALLSHNPRVPEKPTHYWLSFCSSDKFFGTSFAQIFLMCRSSVMIRQMSVFGSPASSAINHTLKHWSLSRTASHEPHCSQFLKLKDTLRAVCPQCSPFHPWTPCATWGLGLKTK